MKACTMPSSVEAGKRTSCLSSSPKMQPTPHISAASVYWAEPKRISGGLHKEAVMCERIVTPVWVNMGCTMPMSQGEVSKLLLAQKSLAQGQPHTLSRKLCTPRYVSCAQTR